MITIEPATLRDASYVTANMRAADRREVYCQLPPEIDNIGVAWMSVENSQGRCWTAFENDEPIACFGLSAITGYVMAVWLFGTDRMKRAVPEITRFMLKHVVPGLETEHWQRLEARVHRDHDLAHIWITAMGARLDCVLPVWGRDGEPFYLYSWDRADWQSGKIKQRMRLSLLRHLGEANVPRHEASETSRQSNAGKPRRRSKGLARQSRA